MHTSLYTINLTRAHDEDSHATLVVSKCGPAVRDECNTVATRVRVAMPMDHAFYDSASHTRPAHCV